MTSKHESTMKNTHDNTIITTRNQTTPDSPKFDIKAIWLGIVPVKLLPESSNTSVEWKMTNKHESTIKNTWHHNHYNRTTLDLLNLVSDPSWLGIVPIKLLCQRDNSAVEWKMTSKHESTMKNTWHHNHYNKQPNNTRLTQIQHQGNLTWNLAPQTIERDI
jgi:hypothetical protein